MALQTGRATILLNIKTKIVGSESHDVLPLVPYSKHMSHYKQHAPESTPFTMWQDLCVAAGHAMPACLAVAVQGSSTTAAMAEYGPVYSTFGERKRMETGAVYGWKVRKVVGVLKHYFYTVWFFDFSEVQWFTKNIGKHTMKIQMMHDVWWIFASMEPRCILRNDAYYDLWHIQMTYWNVFEGNYAWELAHLGLHLNLGWRFFSSHVSTQPFCESLTLECKLTTFFSVVRGNYHYHLILLIHNCNVKHFIYVQHMFWYISFWIFSPLVMSRNLALPCCVWIRLREKNRAKQPTKDLSIDISPPGVRCFSPAASGGHCAEAQRYTLLAGHREAPTSHRGWRRVRGVDGPAAGRWRGAQRRGAGRVERSLGADTWSASGSTGRMRRW